MNASGKRVLCRTENFVDYHTGLNSLLRGEKLLGLLNELAGEPMHLFKEKINYKLAGSGELSKINHVLCGKWNNPKDRWLRASH